MILFLLVKLGISHQRVKLNLTVTSSTMSRGEMFQEFEEKRRKEGFFPQVYKGVCAAMGEENIDKLVSN